MRAKAQHYAIVVVDIEKFGSRSNAVQLWLRERLYELFVEALDEAGVDRTLSPPPSDRGDGFFWLLPGQVDKVDLTGRFIRLLHDKLREHARTSNAEGAMRLRVALHSGDVAWDGRGWQGEELNSACRLVDIVPLRKALAGDPRSVVALAVSADWYRRVVRQGHAQVEHEAFRQVPFDAKEIQDTAWIRVPGIDVPPGTVPSEEKDDDEPRPGTPLRATESDGSPEISLVLNNNNVSGGNVGAVGGPVHGDVNFSSAPTGSGDGSERAR
ncbi:hypothetical protein AB0B50_21560 [Streptomyces sp. NPDC041068]|uniref:hypothetical protein n=1 Tax=Streptomyces sp. NPDC041068 TaxID=3155130 RepID=UPI00340E8E05